jgi:hypothetical protein
MALIFEMAVECGREKKDANAVSQHFQDITINAGTSEQPLLSTMRISTWQDGEGNWWCSIFPSGVSRTGRQDNTIRSAPQVYLIAMGLYRRLMEVRHFRYAVCGYEVTPFDTYSKLLKDKGGAHKPLTGLVLSRAIYEQLGRPVGYREFGEQSYWIPLSEEGVFPG